MEGVIGTIAFIVTLVGLLATLGYAGYLWQLDKVAQRRAGGNAAQALIKKRQPVALGATVVGAVGFLIALVSGIPGDIVAMVLSGGSGLFAVKQLGAANKNL